MQVRSRSPTVSSGAPISELLEALALVQVEHDGGGVLEVVAHVLFDRALVARLRPAALACWEWTLSSTRSVSSSARACR